jgi:hypothetical protein
MKRTATFTALLVLSAVLNACADRGMMSIRPRVKLFEPNQRALVAWDGEEEILLLSTDVRASEPTQVLEFLPLPSEPEVKEGDVEVFQRAVDLINRDRMVHASRSRGGTKGPSAPAPVAGRVTFHERIGAQDISVAEVLNKDGFVKWIEQYLKSKNYAVPELPSTMKSTIGEYLSEGYTWFVFGLVDLDTTSNTREAIQYRFNSKHFYYPLRITRIGEGKTNVEITVLTPKLLVAPPSISYTNIRLKYKPIDINLDELKGLSTDMAELLGNPEHMKLRIWEMDGDLTQFQKDIKAVFRQSTGVSGANEKP